MKIDCEEIEIMQGIKKNFKNKIFYFFKRDLRKYYIYKLRIGGYEKKE